MFFFMMGGVNNLDKNKNVLFNVNKKVVVSVGGTDSDFNHCNENRRWCFLRRRGRSAVRGQTVRDLGHTLDSCLTSRTVRACAGATEFTGSAWISLPGGTQQGRRDPRLGLRIDGPPKMLLIDVEPDIYVKI
jgi:hypothetical protein